MESGQKCFGRRKTSTHIFFLILKLEGSKHNQLGFGGPKFLLVPMFPCNFSFLAHEKKYCSFCVKFDFPITFWNFWAYVLSFLALELCQTIEKFVESRPRPFEQSLFLFVFKGRRHAEPSVVDARHQEHQREVRGGRHQMAHGGTGIKNQTPLAYERTNFPHKLLFFCLGRCQADHDRRGL